MSEIEKAFEAGFRAYRDAFDHFDDSDETVERSLKWRMAQYVAAQQSVQATVQYCPNCKVELVGDWCGKCGLQWTTHRA